MNPVKPSGRTTLGMDLSHWDPPVNWMIAKAASISFCFVKATEGTGVVDRMFNELWAAAKMNGIIRGAYHFFHPSQDPEAQATNFVKAVGQLDAGDLPPVIDWEASDNEPSRVDLGRGQVFLQAIEKALGKKPIVYGSPYFLQALAASKDMAQYPLWVAEYGVTAPKVPPPWTDWDFWQYSESELLPGVGKPGQGRCDANYFNGTVDELKAFIAQCTLTPKVAATVAKPKNKEK